MRRYLVAAALVALVLPTLAAAKGPSSASISGPGLDGPLTIGGNGEETGTALGTLTMASGFFEQVFGQSPDPTFTTRPRGTLGPRYRIVYVVPGQEVRSRIVQHVYPYAKPVAVTHMRPGQRFWEVNSTHGGWFRAGVALRRMLVQAGLPARPPS